MLQNHPDALDHSCLSQKLSLLGRIFTLVFVLGIAGLGFGPLTVGLVPNPGLDLTGPGAPISKINFPVTGAFALMV